jgi:hypothetical protein
MSKIVLTEKQLKKILDRIVEDKKFISEAPVAPGTPGNPGGMTDDEILKRATEIRRVRSTNASLITPGTTANDYFKNPDGTIKVTDLPGVTVTAKRGPAPAINAPKNTLPSTAINNVNAVAAAPNVSATPTATVGSGPTTPAAAPTGTGVQLPTVTVTGQTGPDAAIASAPKVPLPSVATPTTPGVSGQPAAKQMSGQEMHNLLMQKGLINGFTDVNGYENRRIVYKGAPLSQEQLGTLTKYLVDNGYGGRYSQVGDKRYGQKYVWVKGGNALPSDLAA